MSFGRLREVENVDPKSHLADKTYFRVLVNNGTELETLLLTDKELERIRARVQKNPEDTKMVPSWWDTASAAFAGLF